MFLKRAMTKSTGSYWNNIEILKHKIQTADAIVIGAGSGLSTAAGFTYSGERFQKYFTDFIEKYHFKDMYSGGFYPFETPEEYWAYWSRYISVNRYTDAPKPTYDRLLQAVKDKNYFVITTNVDHCFQKAGFDKLRLFYTQGDYGLFQCSAPCHDKTYDNEEIVRKMAENQRDMKIPSDLVPKCPVCGRPMTMNLRADDKFVEDKGWHAACERYEKFLSENENKKILFLELGVGFNTPGIIKYPFRKMTCDNQNARYVCVNADDELLPYEIKPRSVYVSADIDQFLIELNAR